MPVERARNAYRQERLNCAQSVLRGFQEIHGLTDEQIAEARQFGGGKAEGGLCGALYAATLLAEENDRRSEIKQRFISIAGSDQCREIRALKRLTCGECVELAAGLLHEN